jgi:hypothetical protein
MSKNTAAYCPTRNIPASDEDKADRYTAEHFLRLLIDLRRIILQDAAAILVSHIERRQHPFFQLAAFQQPEFDVSNVFVV